ncbi:MAG: hypothetical protein JO265_05195 [Acidimicrobiia bacterium]|nr:hypothetical protein [Acidimicrobiia bacterium]
MTVRRVLAALAGAALAATVVSSVAAARAVPGSGSSPSIGIALGPTAPLLDGGADVSLPVTIVCSRSQPAPAHVDLHQGQVHGAAPTTADYRCTGRSQRMVVVIPAQGGAFHAGDAQAHATLHLCDNGSCSSTSQSATVTLGGGGGRRSSR